ncbi:MAG TPA: hypothetical protein VL282_08860 [Tepidisphaeraceae bacterium]|jgi:hypothetical protein|nr:hypothetical protein [Tepidisphaeraceae bacterium]
MKRVVCTVALCIALLTVGCAPSSRGSNPKATQATPPRLVLPTLGISLPSPRGWVVHWERTGSIGCLIAAGWVRPTVGNAQVADASIVLILADRKAFEDLPPGIRSEPAGDVPALHIFRSTPITSTSHPSKDNGFFTDKFVAGYRFETQRPRRLETQRMLFFLLLYGSPDDSAARHALDEIAHGIRWREPAAAVDALSLSGQLERVTFKTDLWFDLPYPFWNNPFRGMFYQPYSLREGDDDDVYIEVDELKGAHDPTSAQTAARDQPLYYENHGWDLQWRKVSDQPEVYIGDAKPTPPDEEKNVFVIRMILARAPDGRYFRIALSATAKPAIAHRYAALIDDIAKSVTATAPPIVRMVD